MLAFIPEAMECVERRSREHTRFYWRICRFGGGYTPLAIVADSHPIAQPPHTSRNVCREAASPAVETTAKMTAQTIAQAML
ncbi:hypothetical protein MCOL_V207470 [Mycobacterium colombiense CECT 3035]|uniref:Uncharacterized protein n=1 Tax=Mycobacterium colombiense CECT 3035 TaxID=1041522 RepID=J5EF96_9MYCO|nr:hypothetical protein MCOL_V207470 [Mycobacterium colombiense CECT 3035]